MSKECDHTSVGMLINDKDRILLVERKKPPFGFAPPAGHVDQHGSYEQAARDEVGEEVGLTPTTLTLATEGRKDNPCRREGGTWHNWKIYRVETEGELKPSPDETKQARFFTQDELNQLAKRSEKYLAKEISEEEWQQSPGLEPVWYEWLREVEIINKQ